MFPEFSEYSVEIKDKEFIREDGKKFRQSVVLILVSPDGHHKDEVVLGYLEEAEMFRMISEGETMNIDQCYIDQLSLSDYRKKHDLERKELVKLVGFTACNSFFNNTHVIDFEYAEFAESEVSFEHSFFAKSAISMHGAIIRSGGMNFSNTKLPSGNLDFTNLHVEQGEINFKNTIFGVGNIDFQDAVFGDGEVEFTNADFNDGDVSFVNTQFANGKISFKVAHFGTGKIDFHFAKMGGGDVSFERTEFGNGKIDFRTVEFGTGRVNFNRAVFGDGDISFEASQLKNGKISFTRAAFGEGDLTFELAEYDDVDANFDRVDFGAGNISFYNARFKKLFLTSCHFDYYLDLRVARCRYIDLSDSIVRDIMDLQPYEFEIDVDTINFSGMRLIGRIYIDWEKNHVKRLIMSQTDTSKRLKAEQFRTLKENFNITGKYSDEDKSYVEFKRQESLAILEEGIKKNPVSAIWLYPLYAFKLVVLDWAGLYATNPVRVMISMLVSYSIFSLIAAVMTLSSKTYLISSMGESSLTVVGKAFYYIAITFLTIGYGDYYPAGHLHWLAGIVGWVGLFLMSYFTVAFVRKILR